MSIPQKPLLERAPMPKERRLPLESGAPGFRGKEESPSPVAADAWALSDALERDARRFDRFLREEE